MTYISEDSLRELEQIDLETIHARYGEDVSMGDYYVGILPRELRLYDLETGSFTVIASTKEDQYAVSTDAGFVYGKKVLYLCGDTLYVFDMDQAESFALITMEGIINYFLRDHKAIFIVEGDGRILPKIQSVFTGRISTMGFPYSWATRATPRWRCLIPFMNATAFSLATTKAPII